MCVIFIEKFSDLNCHHHHHNTQSKVNTIAVMLGRKMTSSWVWKLLSAITLPFRWRSGLSHRPLQTPSSWFRNVSTILHRILCCNHDRLVLSDPPFLPFHSLVFLTRVLLFLSFLFISYSNGPIRTFPDLSLSLFLFNLLPLCLPLHSWEH